MSLSESFIVLLNCFCFLMVAKVRNDTIAQKKHLVAMDMSDLPNLARSLHSSRKLTPAQIRNRTGFLDSNDRPLIALETIQGWLADTQAPPTQSEARPSTASISDQPKPVLMAAMPPETWLLDPAG